RRGAKQREQWAIRKRSARGGEKTTGDHSPRLKPNRQWSQVSVHGFRRTSSAVGVVYVIDRASGRRLVFAMERL
ncbi:MAG: hypothetical protein MK010_11360, partial [Erythrobacter sp.]|nr:hypothetical protein [Erythrobacter sp.]